MYTKIKISNEQEICVIETTLTGAEILTRCPECGNEFPVDPIEWAHDFPEFSWDDQPICAKCSEARYRKND